MNIKRWDRERLLSEIKRLSFLTSLLRYSIGSPEKIKLVDYKSEELIQKSDDELRKLLKQIIKCQDKINQISELETEEKSHCNQPEAVAEIDQRREQPILHNRAEKTYQRIIATLLGYIEGEIPNVEKHPSYTSDAQLIEAISQHYDGFDGLSSSNLSRKIPECRRVMDKN